MTGSSNNQQPSTIRGEALGRVPPTATSRLVAKTALTPGGVMPAHSAAETFRCLTEFVL